MFLAHIAHKVHNFSIFFYKKKKKKTTGHTSKCARNIFDISLLGFDPMVILRATSILGGQKKNKEMMCSITHNKLMYLPNDLKFGFT